MKNPYLGVITLFLVGCLWLGYIYIENQKYKDIADCQEKWVALYLQVNDPLKLGNGAWTSVCDTISTHKLKGFFAPVNN